MTQGKRTKLSAAQKTGIWRRWKAGQSLHEIGRAFGKPHSCIRRLLLPRGGIPPAARRRSLTWDRGLEMAKHKTFTVATDVKVYFCDPQSPWQRGTNENTNLLLRQYFPRGTDLSAYSQAQLDQVALRLNQRPRKTLGFETPASRLQASVASTV
jgi:IS30 family transposase